MSIAAVVLAAGLSRRMGQPKQLLLAQGEPMVRRTARLALDAGLDPVIVVTGAASDAVTAAIADLPVQTVHNPRFADGQATSLGLGVAQVPDTAEAVMTFVIDQPWLTVDDVQLLVGEWRRVGGIVVPKYSSHSGSPNIFSREFFDSLQRIEGDRGGKQIIGQHPDRVHLVPMPEDRSGDDLDTPEAYEAFRKEIGQADAAAAGSGATELNFIERYLQAIDQKENVALCTVVAVRGDTPVQPGAKFLVTADSVEGSLGHPALEQALAVDARDQIFTGKSRTLTYHLDGTLNPRRDRAARSEPGIDVYCEVMLGQLTLIVVGGGHVGACVAHVAQYAGWRTVIIDDREDFANRERFPDVDEVICDDYETALRRYPINTSTYIICVTRGHKHDEIALRSVIDSPARYIGMIGSKRRVSTVLRHLEEEGVDAKHLERVWTPIGLDIGAETPEEIAISIVAEMVMVRRGGDGAPMALRERRKARGAQAPREAAAELG